MIPYKQLKDKSSSLKLIAKTGLQISFENTQFETYIKHGPREQKVDQRKIKRAEKFKYLGE